MRPDDADARPKVVVFCERLDNESFCESVVRELEVHYDVRPCGPGWAREELADTEDARFFLELDAASGNLLRPKGLERVRCPKFAWLVDTHKKPDFHRALSREMDLTFFAMRNWGHVLEGRAAWLPLHCDTRIFQPLERDREFDVSFVGSYGWRAEPILRIAKKHGLKAHVECTTGTCEKSQTAEIYARSKLVFNRHVANDLNFRVFEATACGRVLLTDAQWNGQYELFDDGAHFVLYTDERDLERKVLRLLSDDELRGRIERQAAEHAHRFHSTRARVAQLKDAIEAYLQEREANVARPKKPKAKKAFLVFAGEAPASSIDSRTYAEGIASELAADGNRVVVARERRCALPAPDAAPRTPGIVELEVPVRQASGSAYHQRLALAGPLTAELARATTDFGPFDAVLSEGGFGALVAQPLAQRLGVPFLLALEECEVARRRNRLTREQLHWAELEQWAAERAEKIFVPDSEAAEDVRRFYRSGRVECRPRALDVKIPGSVGPLLDRLGVETPYTLVLARDLDPRERAAWQRSAAGRAVLIADTRQLWIGKTLVDVPLRGPALAALIAGAERVVALNSRDRRLAEARALNLPVEVRESEEVHAVQ